MQGFFFQITSGSIITENPGFVENGLGTKNLASPGCSFFTNAYFYKLGFKKKKLKNKT